MLLKKIKTNYLDKLFSELVNQNDFVKINTELDKLKNEDFELYFLFLNRIINTYLNNDQGQRFFQNKFIWLNSFDLDDTQIIKNFLSFYLREKLDLNLESSLYIKDFQKLPKELIQKNISFEDLVDNSYLYQYEMLKRVDNKYKLILNNHVFFEKLPNKFFTHYYLTQCFFYVIKNPIHVYANYRSKVGSQQSALNFLNGFTEKNQSSLDEEKVLIQNTTKDWSTNVLSWTNTNVINTFRGQIIKFEELISNPEQILAEVISHLIQAGMEIEIDYDLINNYINNNEDKFSKNVLGEIITSNQENKKLYREHGEVSKKFLYNF
ncbi:hypothetical protein OAS25_05745 [Alphaproteobacteria bacterium]|nr:hypothetical protein [Alphaproteobacteria bacterium]